MAKRFSLQETLDYVFDSNDEDVQDTASEDTSETDEAPETGDNQEQDQYPIGTDEETTDEEDADGEQDTYMSKNGSICWTSSPPPAKHSQTALQMRPGITRYACSHAEDIKSTFELFLTEEIQSIVLRMTNVEGRRVYANEWTDLDLADIQAYIGVVILAGVYRSNNENMESLWHPDSGRAIFGAVMPLKTFRKISRVIRFDDKQTRIARRANDKLAAIRVMWNKWVEQLPLMFNPGPHVTVDECLVPFRGRCPFKQYIPSKPAKYGIKIWAACDSQTSYAWQMQVYTGKSVSGQPEKNQGMRVVLDVTKGLWGHTIFCDNFFTSHALSQELLKRKMTMVGTIRRNKPELPPALLATKDRARFSSMFAFTETQCLVSYCPKKRKNVLLLSTLHRDTSVSSRDDKKPQIILDYNKSKGGVDNLDKMVATYTCKRKTARWPLVLFHNMLDVSGVNAHVLWSEISPEWHAGKSCRRRLFLEELGKALVAPLMEKRQHFPRTPASLCFLKKAKRSLEVENEASTSHQPSNPKEEVEVLPLFP
ncbi:piggyBac transposable element-derived protein 4-like [Rhinichthys klamathensis goyatoka]|uniref:piggyBac transposable element-derived protein 4-like n=1 Tax=Rhinichthys klamathensis goyatoka TaxID=3034132 RepID=UPI0024B4EC9B|nr:piggyBac transposable element-derived protein 4-like [Rhinichthys klamathensis goyatoka]